MNETLLRTHLQAAVPLEIQQLRGTPPDQLAALAPEAAGTVAQHGDDLQFGGRHAAGAMAALTRGLAVLALTTWGGVTWHGMHWCTTPTCHDPDAHHDAPTYPDTARLDPPRPAETAEVTGL